ncbi:hypothetical protein [Leeuwenhoekiella parthenopeia]|uniref:DUF3575 domain-containing protein n=1 Tax=Leeuwenhoekiella parthenopeia TaxID=2890320 RepID=A0ABS8GU12_9FLAO|nr:hypothetical protein [Leeuwenhoekiella parthenopeia]MCC4213497.1 hypothetical protein [Leeuwenhoekiella parthenopeia]
MFRTFLVLVVLLLNVTNAGAQTKDSVSVETSIWGVQTGLLGFWAHNESKLTRTIALRTELGFDAAFYGSNNKFNYILAPILHVEPRWYRNLDRRSRKGKNTANNSADFLSLRSFFVPDLFLISNDDVRINSTLGMTFNGGMRRVYWDHFSFELGLGAGFAADLEETYGNSVYFFPEIFFRLGYNF